MVRARSPSYTWISTPGWLSEYVVEKVSDFLVGAVVLRLMRAVMTPPAVLIPSDKGGDIKEEEILCLLGCVTGKDGGLDSGTVGAP